MRDDETGTWWQQVTGKAIQGPLQGRQLKEVFHDELSFGIWKRERPQGRVLKPDARIASANEYEKSDWETSVGRMRVVDGTDIDRRLEPRTLVRGVAAGGKAVALRFIFSESISQKKSVIRSNLKRKRF